MSSSEATVRVTSFRDCEGVSRQWASFVHEGTGYSVLWRGRPGLAAVEADGPLFDALLKTVLFSR